MGEEAVGSRVRTHRHPADLRPQVPEVQCGCGAHRQLLQNVLILQGLALCREAGHSSGATQAFAHCHRGAQGWSSNSCTHWGPGGGTGGQGTTADLRGEQGVTAHSLVGPKDPTAPPTENKPLWLCGSRTQPGRALAELDVVLPKTKQGHSYQWPHGGAATGKPRKSWAPLWASLPALGGEAARRGPTQRPLPRGAAGGSVAGPWTYGS